MRRYLQTLGFSWAKNVYPENVRPPYSMHNPEWTTVAALEFIEENKDGPFYLLMQQDLEVIGRPFGEFIPGGNAAEPGQIDKQIEIVKQLEIKGKTVTVPAALKKDLGVTDEPTPDDKAKRKAEREARRRARREAKSNNQSLGHNAAGCRRPVDRFADADGTTCSLWL